MPFCARLLGQARRRLGAAHGGVDGVAGAGEGERGDQADAFAGAGDEDGCHWVSMGGVRVSVQCEPCCARLAGLAALRGVSGVRSVRRLSAP